MEPDRRACGDARRRGLQHRQTIFEKRDELILVHKEAQNFDLKHQSNARRRFPTIRAHSSTSPSEASRSGTDAGALAASRFIPEGRIRSYEYSGRT